MGYFKDATKIASCECCEKEFYVGDSVIYDTNNDTYYCDNECMYKDLEIVEVEL